jgi:hypothetical protein
MLDIHHKVLYGAVATLTLGLVGTSVHQERALVATIKMIPSAGDVVPGRVSRHAWPALGQDATIKLGEALTSAPRVPITLYCSNLDCEQLMLDLDDAMQLAGLEAHFERRPVDAESEPGIFVGGAWTEVFKKTLAETTGLAVVITQIDGIDGVGIIIGRRTK